MITTVEGRDADKISSHNAAAQSGALSQLQLDQSTSYWSQSQPEQAGRITKMQYNQCQIREILPAGFSVKSRLHEYNGSAYTV